VVGATSSEGFLVTCLLKSVVVHEWNLRYIKSKMSVCLSVYLCLIHGHSFERICMKFGMWHPYTLRMVTGVSERRSSPRARTPRAFRTLLQIIGRSWGPKLASRKCNGPSAVRAKIEAPSARARCDRAPYARDKSRSKF